MDQNAFTIIFQKLEEAAPQFPPNELFVQPETSRTEMEEIAELRRIVLEVTDPDSTSYTTT